jgi:hypothetical protein
VLRAERILAAARAVQTLNKKEVPPELKKIFLSFITPLLFVTVFSRQKNKGEKMRTNYIKISVAIISCVGLAQFSAQQSQDGKEKPKVNFYGTIVDQSGNSTEVENITLSGLYRRIPVYVKPKRMANPDLNKRYIDLDETAQIRVPYDGENPKIFPFKGRDFVEIQIVSNDGKNTVKPYIVERTRKIYADEKNAAGPIEMVLGIEALDTLTLKGYKEPEKKRIDERQTGE